MKVLFSWIGFKDLNFIGSNLDNEEFDRHLKAAKGSRPTVSQSSSYSPVGSIVENAKEVGEPFDRVILFFDLNDPILSEGVKEYFKRSVSDVDVVDVKSENVHSYSALWNPSIEEWRNIQHRLGSGVFPCFNLSSGTTSMVSLLIVLGKTAYKERGRFLQVASDGKVEPDFSIDFDLGSYAVNEALRQIDSLEFDLSEFDDIIGESPLLLRAKQLAKKAAKTDCNVLLYGETGTGKELFARAIQRASQRKEKAFKCINCAAIPPALLESELFGYSAYAFTGADRNGREGYFDTCDKGTLFIDELEACSEDMQKALLRVLESPADSLTRRTFFRVGDHKKEVTSDVRIIAATNERLDKKSEFRFDLFQRVSALTIYLPALRERPEDLSLLTEKLFEKIKKILGDSFKNKKLSDSAIKFIESRAWLGNVRELKNALTQAIVFSDSNTITKKDFDPNLPSIESVGYPAAAAGASGAGEEIDWSKEIDLEDLAKKKDLEFKMKYIRAARKKCKTQQEAAALLGISYQTMGNVEKRWNKLQEEANRKAETSEK